MKKDAKFNLDAFAAEELSIGEKKSVKAGDDTSSIGSSTITQGDDQDNEWSDPDNAWWQVTW